MAATELSREVGLCLRMARRHVVAVTYHGGVAGYLISPEQYMRILQGQDRPARREEAPPADD